MSASVITTNDICARVRARWGAQLPLAMIPRANHNITLCIFGACERLAKAVKDSTDRHLLVRDINATPSSGVIDLSTATFKNVLIDTYKLDGAIRTQAESSVTFHHAADLNAIRAKTPSDTNAVWYNLTGKKLTFKNPSTDALNTYNTALTLAGSYIPAIDDANWPLEYALEDQLIDRVAETVKELGGLQFLKMDEDMAGSMIKQ